MAPHKRGPWCPREDSYLLQLVHSQGAHNWVRISQIIETRSPKQCRERYHQNLKPSLNHDPISAEEGIIIERLVAEMGKRWAEIARRLHGRSDNAVKNWWNGGMNRRRRLINRRGAASNGDAGHSEKAGLLAYARPATTFSNPPEMAMASPSIRSEFSRAGSHDGVPSLVSDAGSTFSTSPRFPHSPLVELPPLNGSWPDGRRPSLPTLHMGMTSIMSGAPSASSASSSGRPYHGRKAVDRASPQLAQDSRLSPQSAADQDPQAYHYLRHQADEPPLQATALPSFQTLTSAFERTERPDQDERMNVSNLLK